jgi:hypothetical protein
LARYPYRVPFGQHGAMLRQRSLPRSTAPIARSYNVSQSTISRLRG